MKMTDSLHIFPSLLKNSIDDGKYSANVTSGNQLVKAHCLVTSAASVNLDLNDELSIRDGRKKGEFKEFNIKNKLRSRISQSLSF